jgi:cytochrome c-type biogenesis protein CcmH
MSVRSLCICLAVWLAASPAWAQTLDDIQAQHAPMREGMQPLVPELEARVQKLGKEIRCPQCQGLSVADSNSSSARAQMDKIRELVTEGKSDQEIHDFFVSRYGEWALLEPTKSGFNLVLYFAPFVLLAIGLVLLSLRRSKSTAAIPGADAASASSTDTTSASKDDAASASSTDTTSASKDDAASASSTDTTSASKDDAASASSTDTTSASKDDAASASSTDTTPASKDDAVSPPVEDSYTARVLRDMDAPPPAPPPGKEAALALYARYETLLGQLREQHEEQHLLPKEEANKEEARLLEEAAACLRQLDEALPGFSTQGASSRGAPLASLSASVRQRLWLTAATGALIGCVVVFSIQQLLKQAEVASSEAPHAMPAHGRMEDAELKAAFEYFNANPADLDGAAYLTKLFLQRGQWDDATVLVLTGSRADPLHVPFRIYRCLLEGINEEEPGLRRARADELAKLFATYDGAYEAAYWAAALYSALEDKPKALAMLLAFKENAPLEELPPQLDELIAENQASPPPG